MIKSIIPKGWRNRATGESANPWAEPPPELAREAGDGPNASVPHQQPALTPGGGSPQRANCLHGFADSPVALLLHPSRVEAAGQNYAAIASLISLINSSRWPSNTRFALAQPPSREKT